MSTAARTKQRGAKKSSATPWMDRYGPLIAAVFQGIRKGDTHFSRHVAKCPGSATDSKGNLRYNPNTARFVCDRAECGFFIDFPDLPETSEFEKQLIFAEGLLLQDASNPNIRTPRQVVHSLGRAFTVALLGYPYIVEFALHWDNERTVLWNNLDGFLPVGADKKQQTRTQLLVAKFFPNNDGTGNNDDTNNEYRLGDLLHNDALISFFGQDALAAVQAFANAERAANNTDGAVQKLIRSLSPVTNKEPNDTLHQMSTRLAYRLPLTCFHYLAGLHCIGFPILPQNSHSKLWVHLILPRADLQVPQSTTRKQIGAYPMKMNMKIREVFNSRRVHSLVRPLLDCIAMEGDQDHHGKCACPSECPAIMARKYDSSKQWNPGAFEIDQPFDLRSGEPVSTEAAEPASELKIVIEEAYQWLSNRLRELGANQIWIMRFAKVQGNAKRGFIFALPPESMRGKMKEAVRKCAGHLSKEDFETQYAKHLRSLTRPGGRLFGDQEGLLAEMGRTRLPTWAPSVLGDPRVLLYATEEIPKDDPRVDAECFFYVDYFSDYYCFPVFAGERLWGALVLVARPLNTPKVRYDIKDSRRLVLEGISAAEHLGRDISTATRRDILLELTSHAGNLELETEEFIERSWKLVHDCLPQARSAQISTTNPDAEWHELVGPGSKDADLRLFVKHGICVNHFSGADKTFASLLLDFVQKGKTLRKSVAEKERMEKSYEEVAHLAAVKSDIMKVMDTLDEVRDATVRMRARLSPSETGILTLHDELLLLLEQHARLAFIGNGLAKRFRRAKTFKEYCCKLLNGTVVKPPADVVFRLEKWHSKTPKPFFDLKAFHSIENAGKSWSGDYRPVIFCLGHQLDIRFFKELAAISPTDDSMAKALFSLFKLMVQRVHAPSYTPQQFHAERLPLLFDAQLMVTLFEWRIGNRLSSITWNGQSVAQDNYGEYLKWLLDESQLVQDFDNLEEKWEQLRMVAGLMSRGSRPVDLLVPLLRLLSNELRPKMGGASSEVTPRAYAQKATVINADGELRLWIDVVNADRLQPWTWAWGEEARAHGLTGQLQAISDVFGIDHPAIMRTIEEGTMLQEPSPFVLGVAGSEAKLLLRLRRPAAIATARATT
jgi:hypothetical protein